MKNGFEKKEKRKTSKTMIVIGELIALLYIFIAIITKSLELIFLTIILVIICRQYLKKEKNSVRKTCKNRAKTGIKASILSVLYYTFLLSPFIVVTILLLGGYYNGKGWLLFVHLLCFLPAIMLGNLIDYWRTKILRDKGYGLQSLIRIADKVIKNEPDYVEFERNGRRICATKYEIYTYGFSPNGLPARFDHTGISVTHNAKIPAVMEVGGFGEFLSYEVRRFDVGAYLAWNKANPNDLRTVPRNVRNSWKKKDHTLMTEQFQAHEEAKVYNALKNFDVCCGKQIVRVEPDQVFWLLEGRPEKFEPEYLANEVLGLIGIAEAIEVVNGS